MGSGGVRSCCRSTLCILAGIALGLCLLCLLSGGILYGVSSTFTVISNTHLVNRTTASNFTKNMDAKLDNIRSGSAEKGVMLMEKATQLFYSAGGFGIITVIFVALSYVVAHKSRPALAPPTTAGPFVPAPAVEPSAPPGQERDGAVPSPAPPAGSPPPPPPPPSAQLPAQLPSSPAPDPAPTPVE